MMQRRTLTTAFAAVRCAALIALPQDATQAERLWHCLEMRRVPAACASTTSVSSHEAAPFITCPSGLDSKAQAVKHPLTGFMVTSERSSWRSPS